MKAILVLPELLNEFKVNKMPKKKKIEVIVPNEKFLKFLPVSMKIKKKIYYTIDMLNLKLNTIKVMLHLKLNTIKVE